MKNLLTITEVEVSEKKIRCSYLVEGDWERYFNKDEQFYVEYTSCVSETPKGIAVIPLLGTLLTMAWLFDGTIAVDELDEDFYNSIPESKKGYEIMFPHVHFSGKIVVKNIVKYGCSSVRSAQLFSGGADAFATMLDHLNERPDLISVWGADIKATNATAWEFVEKHNSRVAKMYGFHYECVKSNFRDIVSKSLFGSPELLASGDGWWHGFQSGTGLLALVAPYAYCNQIAKLYIASSFTQAQWGKYTCSSDPVIDNVTKFTGCQVYHDGYEYTRQEKIKNICELKKRNDLTVNIRVCWISENGENCCRCEKCHRTMLEIYAEGQDPKDYGFEYGDDFNSVISELKKEPIRCYYLRWANLALRKNYKRSQVVSSLRWVYDEEFPDTAEYYLYVERHRGIKRRIYDALPNFLKQLYQKLKNHKS